MCSVERVQHGHRAEGACSQPEGVKEKERSAGRCAGRAVVPPLPTPARSIAQRSWATERSRSSGGGSCSREASRAYSSPSSPDGAIVEDGWARGEREMIESRGRSLPWEVEAEGGSRPHAVPRTRALLLTAGGVKRRRSQRGTATLQKRSSAAASGRREGRPPSRPRRRRRRRARTGQQSGGWPEAPACEPSEKVQRGGGRDWQREAGARRAGPSRADCQRRRGRQSDGSSARLRRIGSYCEDCAGPPPAGLLLCLPYRLIWAVSSRTR